MHRTAGTSMCFVLLVVLQVLEFHTRRNARDRVALAPFCAFVACIFPFPVTLSRSPDLPFVLTSPSEEPPIVLYSETSFCFILPSSLLLSPSLALSLYGLLYALSSVPFVHADCSHGLDFEPDSLRALRRKKRRGSNGSGQTAREQQNDSREKNETMKGLKLIQLNEKRRRVGTRLIYFCSHPFASARPVSPL